MREGAMPELAIAGMFSACQARAEVNTRAACLGRSGELRRAVWLALD